MNFRTLDLNLLRVFDEIMAERNLTRAARNLAMTQPAVSNSLKRLRETFNDELLLRAGYGVQPTPLAEKLWPTVREALAELRAAMVPDNFEPAASKASFQLAMADAAAALLMPPLVRRVESTAPQVTLRVQPLTTRDPRQRLEDTDLDVAIGYFPFAQAAIALTNMQSDAPSTIRHERLYDTEYVCVMRRDHPLATGTLTLDAYCNAHHLLVSFSGRPFGFIDEALALIKRQRRIVLTLNQFYTAGRVVANSDLLTVLPKHFLYANGMEHDFALRPLPFAMQKAHVDMLWHRRNDSRPAHQWLRMATRESALIGFAQAGPRSLASAQGELLPVA
jgi:DNA-binding transcriptional LysR family regulator